MARWLASLTSLTGALILLAGSVAAQPLTGHLSSDAFLETIFVGSVAEGRIGNRTGTDPYELSLGQLFPIQTGQFSWVSGTTYNWTLSYEPGSIGGAVRFNFEGAELVIPTVTAFNSFFIRTSAELPNTSIRVSGLSLGPAPSAGGGGTTIFETASPGTAASSFANGSGAKLDVLKISNVDLLAGFTLKGKATMEFAQANPQPTGAQLVFEVYAADDGNPPGAVDTDGDGVLDDGDGSGVAGDAPCADGVTVGCDDNCKNGANANQADSDGDGRGDVCDNCPFSSNPGQADGDRDGAGDVCDNCPIDCTPVLPPLDNCKNAPRVLVPGELPVQPDDDGDGVGNKCDNCRVVGNPGQEDDNGDGRGDVCEPTIVSLFSDAAPPAISRVTAASAFTMAVAEPVDLQLRLFCGPRNIAFANIGILLPEPASSVFDNFSGCTDQTGSLDDPTQRNCKYAGTGTGLGDTVSPASSTLGPGISTTPGISDQFVVLRLQGNLDRGFANPLLCEAFDPNNLNTQTNVELGVLRLTDLPPDSAPQLDEGGLAALGLGLLTDATNQPVAAAEIESSVDVSGADPILVTMSVNPNFDDGKDGRPPGRRFAVIMDSALEIGSMAFGLRGPVGITPGEMVFGGCTGGPVTADGTVVNTCLGGAGNLDLGPGVADSGSGSPPVTFTIDPNHPSKPAAVPSDTLMLALKGKIETIDGFSLNDPGGPTILGVVEYLIDSEAPPQAPPTIDFTGATALPGVTVPIQPLDGTTATNQVARVGGGNADLDSDSDKRGDNADNCPNKWNPDQQNRGGVRVKGAGADFIGDLCTCGDSSGDGVVDDKSIATESDVADCQQFLALPPGEAEGIEAAQRCSVTTGEAGPTIIDLVVLELDLIEAGSAGATIEQVCVPAN